MGSFSFDAGTSERVELRPNTTAPVVRSRAMAAECAAGTCGTARAWASRCVSGFELADRVAPAVGNATAAAQTTTAARARRIDPLFGPIRNGSRSMGLKLAQDSPRGP